MRKKVEKIKKGLGEVFKKPSYTGLALGIAMLFFMLNMLLPNLKTLVSAVNTMPSGEALKFTIALIQGGLNSITTTSFYTLLIIATLLGMVVSLLTYKIKKTRMFSMQGGKATTMGTILGLAAPGCASCGIGLLSAVGLTSVIAYLPFKGIEIGFLSIALLLTSTGSLATRIADGESCQIKTAKKK